MPARLVLTLSRTLFITKDGLEDAKKLIAAYKQGEIKEMNERLWKAKKIVDSTLHPGCRNLVLKFISNIYRYGRACLSTIPDVMLRDFQSSSYCWNAYSISRRQYIPTHSLYHKTDFNVDSWYSALANHKSVIECRYQ